MAVDAFRVVAAVLTQAAALVQAVDVQRLAQSVDLRIVDAFVGMSETVASYYYSKIY